MYKGVIISEILSKIFQMSIPYLQGVGTDISINYDFLDAKWSTGRKTIHYEAYAYFNEQLQTIFLYELTKERTEGLSFGNKSECYTQMGTTLYRKVKGVKYGPEGMAYEYEMNLGDIINVFKNSAKNYGWKVKTVIHKEDAMYPEGYAASPYAEPNIPPCFQSDTASHSRRNPPAYSAINSKKQDRYRVPVTIFLLMITLACAGFIYIMQISPIGWILIALVLLITYMLSYKLLKR